MTFIIEGKKKQKRQQKGRTPGGTGKSLQLSSAEGDIPLLPPLKQEKVSLMASSKQNSDLG